MNTTTPSSRRLHVADDPRAPNLSLTDAVAIFLRRLSPRLMLGLVTVIVTARIVVGGFTVWDAVVALALVGLQPITEWVIHVVVLHWRPRKLGPFTLDTKLSAAHRAHHVDPNDEQHWFIPLGSGLIGLGIVAAVGWVVLAGDLALWLTWMMASQMLTFVYEWTHYLCHSAYRPQSDTYKRIWRYHRLHHFKNENYWLGVTAHLGDRLFGTLPLTRDVDTSPTCRDLHG